MTEVEHNAESDAARSNLAYYATCPKPGHFHPAWYCQPAALVNASADHWISTHATAFGWGWGCSCGATGKGTSARSAEAAYAYGSKHVVSARRKERERSES